MVWEDVPASVRQLYTRRWPKLNLNAHLRCSPGQMSDFQGSLPKDVFPGIALDWEEFIDVPAAAWRMPVAHAHPACQRQGAAAKRALSPHA
jgi:hypothetical protein